MNRMGESRWVGGGGSWVPNRGKRDIFIRFSPKKESSLFHFIGKSKEISFLIFFKWRWHLASHEAPTLLWKDNLHFKFKTAF